MGHAPPPGMKNLPSLTLAFVTAFSPQAWAGALNPGCMAGDPFACLEGEPTVPSATRACSLGQSRGCLVVAKLKPTEALTWVDKACKLGDPVGCYETGLRLVDAKRPDTARAFVALYLSCRQGHGPACTLVGTMHADGKGTAKDPTRAAMAFRNGCERQDAPGCLLLGKMMTKPAESAAAFDLGCRLKSTEACTQLEALTRQGVKPSAKLAEIADPLVEAEKILRRQKGSRNPVAFVEVDRCPREAHELACVNGDLAVCQQAADLQQNGGDGAAAYCMKKQACERGDGHACEQLGTALVGSGLPTAARVALGWFEKGCQRGSAAGCEGAVRLVEFLERSSTPNQRATRELELRVKGCSYDDLGDCSLVYTALLSKIPDASLTQRAWITLGRWCEREPRNGSACSAVAARREAIVLERGCSGGNAASCRAAAELLPDPVRQSVLLSKACTLGDCEGCVTGMTVEGAKPAEIAARQTQAAKVCAAECQATPADTLEPRACVSAVKATAQLGGAQKALLLAEGQCKRGFTCKAVGELWFANENLTAEDDARLTALMERACADKRPGTCAAISGLAQVKPARAACRDGSLDACLRWGESLNEAAVALPQTADAWGRACKLGSSLGCVREWAALSAAHNDPKAVEQAHLKASAACENGEIAICIELANQLKFHSQEPLAVEELKAIAGKVTTSLGARCDEGDVEACEDAANFFQFKKELDGETRARGFIVKACDHGAGGRCVDLAEQRIRVKDYAGAADFGARGCAAGSTAGCRIVVKHRLELTDAARVKADRSLGIACGKKVADACGLAADVGVKTVVEAAAGPAPMTRN